MSERYSENSYILQFTDFMNDAGAKYFADLVKNSDLPSGVKIASKLKLGAAGVAVDAVELIIAVSSGDSYRATLETAEFIVPFGEWEKNPRLQAKALAGP